MILLDSHESNELEQGLAASLSVHRMDLNGKNYADIYWSAPSGTHQIENKAVTEIIYNYEHVEGQLQKQYNSADHNYLLVRGIADLTYNGNVGSYTKQGDKFFVRTMEYRDKIYRYRAWLDSLDLAGICVIEVPTLTSAIAAIVSRYKHSQDNTCALKGYYREKIVIPERNPHVHALMYLSLVYNLNIGHDKATALIETFGTLDTVLKATIKDLCTVKGIGKITAKALKERYKDFNFRKGDNIPRVQTRK